MKVSFKIYILLEQRTVSICVFVSRHCKRGQLQRNKEIFFNVKQICVLHYYDKVKNVILFYIFRFVLLFDNVVIEKHFTLHETVKVFIQLLVVDS